jgi:pyruvate,water dikinase
MDQPMILSLDSPDVPFELAGGEGASLNRLIRAGFPVPGGFIVTTAAYEDYVAANGLAGFIEAVASAAPASDPAALEAAWDAIRTRFALGQIPAGLGRALRATYGALEISSIAVAVRSSATAEDLPEFSFAGQQDTFLNVVGEEALLRAVVAREYGLPAVVGVTGATTRLATGQRVRVDGTSGRVTVL